MDPLPTTLPPSPPPPRVFISHASEDKERFVLPFARALRAHGIDAWLDTWEMRPGDSLVDKIFTEGIGNADIVVVVLSHASINKPWVREEINAAFVRRVKQKTRLLPILLDDCAVPIPLESTVHVHIRDLQDYTTEFQDVVDTIFQVSTKPSLGAAPRYTRLAIDQLPGLTSVDTVVFRSAVEATLAAGLQAVGTASWSHTLTDELDLRAEQIDESLHILEDRHLIDIKHEHAGHVMMFKVFPFGLENYLRHCITAGDHLLLATQLVIVNDQLNWSQAIAERLGQPHHLILLALAILEYHRYILLSPASFGAAGTRVRDVTPLGRRYVTDQTT